MLTVGNPVAFAADEAGLVLTRNCAPPEAAFMWSTGRWCELVFDVEFRELERRTKAVELTLDLDVFKFPPVVNGQNVVAFVNGFRVASRFIERRTVLALKIRLANLLSAGNVLILDLPDAARPTEFGLPDDRMLGAQLYSLGIDLI